MGDSVCIMPAAFSYTSGLSNEANQGNLVQALGESVSFGRFMTESLAWEKWSSFSQKRHVEEAERYAQPGSVAQKKAFFEAHYKRIAAKKAAEAALLEQENAAADTLQLKAQNFERDNTTHDSETMGLISQLVADDQQELIANADELNITANPESSEIDEAKGADPVIQPEILGEIPTNIEPLDRLENVEDKNMVHGLESTGTPLIEKPLLKNYNSNQDVPRSVTKKKPVRSSMRSTMFRKVASSPATSIAPLHTRKENNFTPRTTKSTTDFTDKKRSTPKSLRKSINFTPAREPAKSSTPAIRNNGSSRIAPTSCKSSKELATPLRAPIMASVNGKPRHPPITTPCSEDKRGNTILDPSASGSKTTGPKWHLISSVCSKSMSACRKKLQSSTPFTLRTELRAAKRKQKLEERFNEKEAQKVEMQMKCQEKSETEIRKMRQSLCFRARPLPDFYKDRETSKRQTKKTPEMYTQSPNPQKTPGPSIIEETKPLMKSSTKNNAFKNVLKKENQTPSQNLTSLPTRRHRNVHSKKFSIDQQQ